MRSHHADTHHADTHHAKTRYVDPRAHLPAGLPTRRYNQTGIEVTDGVAIVDVGDHDSYTWTGVAPDTDKCTRVHAYNAGGHSDWSSPVCATTLPLPAVPAVPGNISAVDLSSTKIQISWTENSNQTGFYLTDGTFSVALDADARSYTWPGLAPETTKCFRISAYNAGGSSDPTGPACTWTLSILHDLIAASDRAGIKAGAEPLSIAQLNAAVAALTASDREALANVLLVTAGAATSDRISRLHQAMVEVLNNPQVGFYAEIWRSELRTECCSMRTAAPTQARSSRRPRPGRARPTGQMARRPLSRLRPPPTWI